MDDAQRAVALVDRADDDPEAENVRELAQRQQLPLHLAPDRIGPLLAPGDFRLDAVLGQLLRQLGLDRLAGCPPLSACSVRQTVVDDLVARPGSGPGMQMSSSSSRTACMPMRPASGA
jgi:hypothetical protein